MSVETITQGLLKNTSKLFKLPQMDLETATEIGEIVNKIENIFPFKVDKLFENALICQILKFKGLDKYSFLYSIVSIPSKDITDIVIGDGFENHENANLQNNAETTHKKAADALFKQYYLNSLPPNLRKLHESGWLHIHDLEYFGTRPFCADLDLRYFFYYGLMPDGRGIKASVSGPAKHVEVAVLHAVKALGASQTNFSGGQGYYNFLTFLAPYFKGLEYPRIKQLMQMFVFEMTQMMVARGGQTVFSSVQLSPGVPKMWQDKPVVACGKVHNGIQAPLWTYGELERENRLLFQALMEVLLQGDYWGKPFSFPKPEILFDHEFVRNLDAKLDGCLTYRELYMMAFNLAAKTGSPYFDNCLPSYRGEKDSQGVRCYQCCAYSFRTDNKIDESFDKKLQFEDGKHFSMGAYQVITLNLPRMAYASGDYDKFLDILREYMDRACDIFLIKKKWMDKIRASDRMPFITQHPIDPNCPGKKGPEAVDLSQYTYVIGVVGLNECVKKLIKKGLADEDDTGFETGLAIIAEMQEYIPELEKKYGIKLSLARTPAETVAGRFAVLDLMDKNFKYDAADVLQGDVVRAMQRIGAGEATMDEPVYYSNGTHLPVSADVPLGLKIKREGAFFPLLSGGDIFHIFLGEENPNPEAIMNMAFKIAQCTDIGYFAFTRDFTVCLSCNRLSAGLKEKCPSCNSLKVDHISRVTGYAQAVSGWNEAKKQELKDRRRYKIWI